MSVQANIIVAANTPRTASDLSAQLQSIHSVISSRYPVIDRVAVALYDSSADLLKTFISSNVDEVGLSRYQACLAQVPSLSKLAQTRQSRLIRNIDQALKNESTHTLWLKERGYRCSYTVPVYYGDELASFVFFDSKSPDAFDQASCSFLEVFASMICRLYLLELRLVHGLAGTVRIASGLALIRDLETGQHLKRMAAYSRLIGRKLAEVHGLSDEYIEYLHMFAPLHDVGKVGIPDAVLLKPGALNAEEWQIMRSHVDLGERFIDEIVKDLGIAGTLSASVMRNIVACHHERGDGSGYPRGLSMDEIPLEGRIVAVADVYDALGNRRPYKPAWSPDKVAAELGREVERGRLDEACVDALMLAESERDEIKRLFPEENLSSDLAF